MCVHMNANHISSKIFPVITVTCVLVKIMSAVHNHLSLQRG